jgi:pimeloyl-ACP methyl ester carboxylesterase
MRRVLHVAVCMVVSIAGFAVANDAPAQTRGVGLLRRPVEFEVTHSTEGGATRRIVGYRYDTFCESPTAVLLMHGLSYTKEAWDFPGYSVVQKLAAAGYAVFAIDRLGYGESKLDNGHLVTHEAMAGMADQIVKQLRAQGFQHVVLGGHSAGAGATELAAGAFGGVDAIMALGWHHAPSEQIRKDFATHEIPEGLRDDYVYFLGTPEHRAFMFYDENADRAVVEADKKAAVLTPSGEILSIWKQPSRSVVGNIKVPVFLQFADGDRIFEPEYAEMHKIEFVQSPSVTVDMVPNAGHTFMLTKSGLAGTDRMVSWLRSRPEAPFCG